LLGVQRIGVLPFGHESEHEKNNVARTEHGSMLTDRAYSTDQSKHQRFAMGKRNAAI
jgi:hypothetical protein